MTVPGRGSPAAVRVRGAARVTVGSGRTLHGTGARAWWWSGLASAAVLAVLASYAERAAFSAIAGALSWPALVAGVVLLQVEGILSALRTRALAGAHGLRDSLVVTAWWVAALATLPARLGELIGVGLLTRRLGQSLGQALNNLFVQRLCDGVVLLALGAVAVASHAETAARAPLALLLLLLALVAAVVLAYLAQCFALVARCLAPARGRRHVRPLLRAALHGRHAARSGLSGRRPLGLVALSVAKWCCNLAGVGCLIAAVVPALPLLAAATLAILVNVVAVVPLSTVGGVGLGDLTIAGGLAWYGESPARAAAAALCVRLLLIVAPLVFWLLVTAADRLCRTEAIDARG